MSRHNLRFEERLEQVKQYCAENSTGWIPVRYDTEPRTRMGYWANDVRYKYKKGELAKNHEEQLRAVGFRFERAGMGFSVRVKNLKTIRKSQGGNTSAGDAAR